jgi:LysM repeat protein
MTSTAGREAADLAAPRTACPYLLIANGRWRNAEPTRDQVCTTEAEALPVTLDTQRRLCFGDHAACDRFVAARAAYSAAVPLAPLRPIARTTPVVIDRGRAPLPLPRVSDRRGLGQTALALIMVAAVVAVLVARLGSQSGVVGPSVSPSPLAGSFAAVSPTPTASPLPTPTVAPTPSPTPRATPSARPRPTPSPVAGSGKTYTVKAGDTLSSIAARFGTTVKILSKLNGITDPSLIKPGQVLKLP